MRFTVHNCNVGSLDDLPECPNMCLHSPIVIAGSKCGVLQVVMLVGQSLLLGELVDYFTDVGQGQFVTECIGLPSSGTLSTTEAYMAALGERVVSAI